MATSFTNNYQIKLIGTGLEAGTWGSSTNENWERIEQALGATKINFDIRVPPTGSTYTSGTPDQVLWITNDAAAAGAAGSEGRCAAVQFTNAAKATTVRVRGAGATDYPDRIFIAWNTSGYTLTFNCNATLGTNVYAVENGAYAILATTSGDKWVRNILANLQINGLVFPAAALINLKANQESALEIKDSAGTYIDVDTRTSAQVVSLKTANVVTGAGGASVIKSSGNNDITLQTGHSSTGSITITDGSNGSISITPEGTGELVVGNASNPGAITTGGSQNLVLDTNAGVDSGSITITDAANGNISLASNGSGDINLTPATGKVVVGSGSAAGTITTNSTQDLVLDTNDGVASGSITITDAANGSIALVTNGNGDINLTTGSTTGGVLLRDDGYLNFDTTTGTSGYGVRDNSGAVESKNASGGWFTVLTGSRTATETGQFFYNVFGTLTEILAMTSAEEFVNHGLGGVPSLVTVALRCTTNDHSYAVNDEIPWAWSGVKDNGGDTGLTCIVDSSQVGVFLESTSNIFVLDGPGTTHKRSTATDSSWSTVVRAWK